MVEDVEGDRFHSVMARGCERERFKSGATWAATDGHGGGCGRREEGDGPDKWGLWAHLSAKGGGFRGLFRLCARRRGNGPTAQ